MALIPSGRVRQMQAQGVRNFDNGLKGIFAQMEEDQARKDVTQQNVGDQQGAGGTGQPTSATQPPAGADGLQKAVNQDGLPPSPQPASSVAPTAEPDDAGGDIEEEKEHMRSVFFNIVKKHFGINPEEEMKQSALKNREFSGGASGAQKEINKKLRQLFDVDIQNPLSNQPIMKGFFVIPNEVKGKRLDYKKTVPAAAEFTKRYGLKATSVKEDDGGWRYEFVTYNVQQSNEVQTGTSYDAVLSGDGQKKAASFNGAEGMTMGEMLQFRRNDLYETMRKIACSMEKK